MRGWLLDTNVVSELRKPRPNSAVAAFVAAQPGEALFTTEVTFGEIRFGIEQLEDAGRRADIHLWLNRTLRPLFFGRVLAITEDVIVRWKTMAVEGQKRRHTFGLPDLVHCRYRRVGRPRRRHARHRRVCGRRSSSISCTRAAKRCELNHPHPSTRWLSFSGLVDNWEEGAAPRVPSGS